MKDFIIYVKNADIENLNTIDFTSDVYFYLNSKSVDYSACLLEVINSNITNEIMEDTYRITIVDKLNEDESNLLDIYDNSKRQFQNLLNYIDAKYDVSYDSIDYIKQDFADKLAGIYVNITITYPNYTCDYE